MIYLDKPKNFFPIFLAVGCFIEHDGKILLLLRQDHKSEGNTWGLPSGKVNKHEHPEVAMIREIKEETGLNFKENEITFHQKLFVRSSLNDFTYYIFFVRLDRKPDIRINPKEHKDYDWLKPERALTLPLIEDLDSCIKLIYEI